MDASPDHTDTPSPPITVTVCSSPPLEPSLVIIDPDGDLTLLVGEARYNHKPTALRQDSLIDDILLEENQVSEDAGGNTSDGADDEIPNVNEVPVSYIVCSKTVARASRAWKRLLYGGFAESKPASHSTPSDWVVKLPHDNPESMEIILNIIHSRFGSLPPLADGDNIEQLYQLTILTDKYDLTALLQPWAPAWLSWPKKRLQNTILKPSVLELERISWIAWQLGDRKSFNQIFETLILACSIDTAQNLYGSSGDGIPLFTYTLEPPGLIDQIKLARMECIENVIAIYDDAIKKVLNVPPESSSAPLFCRYTGDPLPRKHKSRSYESRSYESRGHEGCDSMILGNMMRSLFQKGYWPLPEATQVEKSVRDLASDLQNIEITSSYGCTAIENCEEKIGSILDNINLPITPAQRNLTTQRAAMLEM